MKQQEPKPRDPELIAIGERARLAREAQGLSREKLAEAADTSPQFLAQMEKGEQSMTTLKLKRLATALHVSSDYLLYGQPPFTDSAELAVELLAQMSPVDRDFLSDMLLRLNRLLRESDPNHE